MDKIKKKMKYFLSTFRRITVGGFVNQLIKNSGLMSKCRTVASALKAAIALSKNVSFVIVQQISTVFLEDIILGTINYCVKDICGYFHCALETGKVVWVLSFDH